MTSERFGNPRHVLVFNGQRKLIAIARSSVAIQALTGHTAAAIRKACSGEHVSSKGFYFRYIHEDVIVTLDDLNTLDLQEYDDLCEVTRDYYTVRQMSRRLQTARGEELAPLKRKRKSKRKRKKKQKPHESSNHQ